ncbi:MAG: type II toxin-antitoxin system VapB family antitoxin, partial [Treponema socranskii subsp. buccale]
MKTTIVLEDVKLKKAFALTKIKTKTELIDVALDNLIKRYQI